MTTADHIIDQIDAALGDYSVGLDAMRSAPGLPTPTPRVQLSFSAGPREILIRRLIEQHGLTRMTARHAVLAAERGGDSERADLVRTEACAVAAEMGERIRAAFQPMAEAAVAALKQLSESLARLRLDVPEPGKPARRRDRPAWQSPYGPARRR